MRQQQTTLLTNRHVLRLKSKAGELVSLCHEYISRFGGDQTQQARHIIRRIFGSSQEDKIVTEGSTFLYIVLQALFDVRQCLQESGHSTIALENVCTLLLQLVR